MFGHNLLEHTQNLLSKADALAEDAGLKLAVEAFENED